VVNDWNANGQRDSTEGALGGFTVTLSAMVAGVLTQVTTAVSATDGSFSFSGLNSGTYVVTAKTLTGWASTYTLNAAQNSMYNLYFLHLSLCTLI
jgi:hypothetical protein